MSEMTSNRPYLLRAFYEWIQDNTLTPYILVDASIEGVHVPEHYIKDGKIVLSIAAQAVKDLWISNETLTFSARFAGIAYNIDVPVYAVMAIYAKENGQGMFFQHEPTPESDPPKGKSTRPKSDGTRSNVASIESAKPKPSLKVVK